MPRSIASPRSPSPPPRAVPVTLISGLFGAGKTSLLTHLLKHNGGLRIAIVLNDISDVDFDIIPVQEVMKSIGGAAGNVVPIENGCVCCMMQVDLFLELRAFAWNQFFDCIIVETSGSSLPSRIVNNILDELRTVDYPRTESESLPGEEHDGEAQQEDEEEDEDTQITFKIDTIVVVVDALNMLQTPEMARILSATPKERRADASILETECAVSKLVIEQIKTANVIIMNKVDLLGNSEWGKVITLIRLFSPKGVIIHTNHGAVDPSRVLCTGLFNMDKAMAEYKLNLSHGIATPDSSDKSDIMAPADVNGIQSYRYRRIRPFHPRRLYNFVNKHYTARIFDYKENWKEMRQDSEVIVNPETARQANPTNGNENSGGSRMPHDNTIPATSELPTGYGIQDQSRVTGQNITTTSYGMTDEALIAARTAYKVHDQSTVQSHNASPAGFELPAGNGTPTNAGGPNIFEITDESAMSPFELQLPPYESIFPVGFELPPGNGTPTSVGVTTTSFGVSGEPPANSFLSQMSPVTNTGQRIIPVGFEIPIGNQIHDPSIAPGITIPPEQNTISAVFNNAIGSEIPFDDWAAPAGFGIPVVNQFLGSSRVSTSYQSSDESLLNLVESSMPPGHQMPNQISRTSDRNTIPAGFKCPHDDITPDQDIIFLDLETMTDLGMLGDALLGPLANPFQPVRPREPPDFSILKNIVGSKGQWQLATRPSRRGEWFQSGGQLILKPGKVWYCTLPDKTWAGLGSRMDRIRLHDNIAKGGEWGDRASEIVFYGEGVGSLKIDELFDECELNDQEFGWWQTIMRDEQLDEKKRRIALKGLFDDPWPEWDENDVC